MHHLRVGVGSEGKWLAGHFPNHRMGETAFEPAQELDGRMAPKGRMIACNDSGRGRKGQIFIGQKAPPFARVLGIQFARRSIPCRLVRGSASSGEPCTAIPFHQHKSQAGPRRSCRGGASCAVLFPPQGRHCRSNCKFEPLPLHMSENLIGIGRFAAPSGL